MGNNGLVIKRGFPHLQQFWSVCAFYLPLQRLKNFALISVSDRDFTRGGVVKGRERETPSGPRLTEVRLEPFYAAPQLGAHFCQAIVDHTAQGGLAAPARGYEAGWGVEEDKQEQHLGIIDSYSSPRCQSGIISLHIASYTGLSDYLNARVFTHRFTLSACLRLECVGRRGPVAHTPSQRHDILGSPVGRAASSTEAASDPLALLGLIIAGPLGMPEQVSKRARLHHITPTPHCWQAP
ncbi:hypothetical protein EYF80_007987 [Liparis tanakae]|uniref:Uncharacterized protein n=1 Tax=Liparis tanakae TaxID=230148 RepID=A0A4Z2IWF6_9TELE|nr:hypothetical protein EYF80_007987 [Liparis tanakae]